MEHDRVTDPKESEPGQGGKSRPSIDPKSVMENALKSIVNRADTGSDVEAPAGGSGPSPATPKRGRQRKRRRPEGRPAGEPRAKQGPDRKQGNSPMGHANDAVRSLSTMVRQLLDSQKVHFLSRRRFMELTIRVPMDAQLDGSRTSAKLVDQVLKLVKEVRENDSALVPRSVYCFFSESAEAEGCRPSESRQVFDGYGSTGRPKFTDFVTMAIERKSTGIDALLAGEEITLTHVTQGRVLRTTQLAEFGKSSAVYRILGQVDAGLFAVRGQEAKAAYSFQVLLGKDLKGGPVLRLHPVGLCDVMNLEDHSVAQILRRFQGDLDEAALRLRGKQSNGDAPDEEAFVAPLLQDLAKRLQDRAKHRSRRTEHADRRASKSTRPTNKAYSDAQAVGDNDLLWDQEGNTFIVVGQQGRAHVFNQEARHVTSVTMNAASVAQRIKTHRWRKTEPAERGEFRMQLRALVKNHREGDPGSGRSKKAAAKGGDLLSKLAQLSPQSEKPAETPAATPAETSFAAPEQTRDSAPAETKQHTPAEEAPVPETPEPENPQPVTSEATAEPDTAGQTIPAPKDPASAPAESVAESEKGQGGSGTAEPSASPPAAESATPASATPSSEPGQTDPSASAGAAKTPPPAGDSEANSSSA